jgi:hypothetical protein
MSERERSTAAQDARIAELEDWSRGEVEAVRTNAEQQLVSALSETQAQ